MSYRLPACFAKTSMFYRVFPKPFLLHRLKKDIVRYSAKFDAALQKHLRAEFEVQIRDGCITAASDKIIAGLVNDFEDLQYHHQLRRIFQMRFHAKSRRSYISDLLDVVEEKVKDTFDDLIRRRQTESLKSRRKKNNQLCSRKCANGPTIFNFTDSKISPKLEFLLRNGLKNVPLVKPSIEELIKGLEMEAIMACKNLFFSYYGYFPNLSSNHSLNQSFQIIISQCLSNSEIVCKLVPI